MNGKPTLKTTPSTDTTLYSSGSRHATRQSIVTGQGPHSATWRTHTLEEGQEELQTPAVEDRLGLGRCARHNVADNPDGRRHHVRARARQQLHNPTNRSAAYDRVNALRVPVAASDTCINSMLQVIRSKYKQSSTSCGPF
jgi:hypothetical protein